MPLYAMAGGYAMSGRGPLWGRIACAVVALTVVPIWTLTVTGFVGPDFAVTTARGAWVALYYFALVALFMIAAAVPHRPVRTADGVQDRSGPSRKARARAVT